MCNFVIINTADTDTVLSPQGVIKPNLIESAIKASQPTFQVNCLWKNFNPFTHCVRF